MVRLSIALAAVVFLLGLPFTAAVILAAGIGFKLLEVNSCG